MRTLAYTTILIVLVAGTGFSQSYQLEYEYLGEYTTSEFEQQASMIPNYFDLNGDGTMEIVIRVGGEVDRLVFINGADYSEIWSYSRGGSAEISFRGLMDLDGDGDPEMLVSSYGILEVVEVPSGTTVATIPREDNITVYDYDGDGILEILVNSSTGVQIWGWNPVVGVPDISKARGALSQNHPNPFNPRTTINYQVQSAGDVQLEILDLQGRLVRTLVSGSKPAGEYKVAWDGVDESGRSQASGCYFYVLHVGDFVASRRMLLLK